MGWHRKLLVVANVTAESAMLRDALLARASKDDVTITLLVCAEGAGGAGRRRGEERLATALQVMRDAGLDATGVVGDADPVSAVQEIWDPRRFDEIVVSTLPGQTSRWIRSDTPHRLARLTDVPVTHVIATDMVPAPVAGPPPAHEPATLGPLSVLSWGGQRHG